MKNRARTIPLVVGVRAWARPAGEARRGKRTRRRQAQVSEWTFTFDTETTVDAAQNLRVGCFRISQDGELVQEGLFYDHVDAEERALLEEIRNETGIALLSMQEFRDWFFHYVYRLQATIIGHNLPFDLSRLATDWAPARGRFKGGFSFVIWPRKDAEGENRFRPRLRIKSLNRRAALIEFAGVAKDERDPQGYWPGRFVDTKTLAAALTDKSLSLGGAAEIFGTAHRKIGDTKHGEPLTRKYVEYLRRDVLVTEELYLKLGEEFERHPIDLDASRAYSSASIGKAYLRAFGITPPAERSGVSDEVMGYCMNAFFGGRVECRIRKELVPITYLDVRSMYPTVFSLLGLQRFLTADQIDCEDATEEVRELLEGLTPDRLFDRRSWPELCAICEVEPDGEDILPVRAKYGGAANRSIGLNYVESAQPLWYSLPDVVASLLLTGKAPRIRRAIRFTASGRLASLRPVKLRGEVQIDPREEEIFKRVIEERHRVKSSSDLSEAEAEGRQRFLKTFANATSYGIFVELNRQEPGLRPKKVKVFSDHTFETSVSAIELPGLYCFPPLAVLITGAARLILAMVEREVSGRGGAYAFCDTDSMAILTDYSAREGGGDVDGMSDRPDVLSIEEISEIVEHFESLSPYKIPGSILEVEPENFAIGSKERLPLYAYVVSAKRYVLLNVGLLGGWVVRRLSEHGLGTYVDPGDDE